MVFLIYAYGRVEKRNPRKDHLRQAWGDPTRPEHERRALCDEFQRAR